MPGSEATDEEMPLLPNRNPKLSQPVSFVSQCRRHLTANVSRDWADVILVCFYFVTGLLDSALQPFTSRSSIDIAKGNTVYIGLGLAAPAASTRWIKSGVSLLSFCIGSFLFSRFHRLFSPQHRWVLCASFTVQLLLTAAAAGMVTAAGTPTEMEHIGWQVLTPIALLAFQSCGQAVASRVLKYNALTSVVLTSIYCDLFSDAELFALRNVERNRRTGAPLFLLLGAFVGGRFANSSFGVAGALWTATGLKAVAVLVWLVWPAEVVDESEEA
ncbi:hypothetical protein NEMBOFW57_002014 [Staphylotrichum longicolle]|uniref:DUF1275 domain protein n=1 Tax=Staphylotrichum longicolle TaxID=669026 RepID=A0AAD4F2X6_9PEZI|nr:hypothetical protein NEMBOFW57_002014 [Staphylotrichum longicolle]